MSRTQRQELEALQGVLTRLKDPTWTEDERAEIEQTEQRLAVALARPARLMPLLERLEARLAALTPQVSNSLVNGTFFGGIVVGVITGFVLRLYGDETLTMWTLGAIYGGAVGAMGYRWGKRREGAG